MSFMDSIKSATKSVTNSVSNTVSTGSTKLKLNREVKQTKIAINRTYTEIGKKYAELNRCNPSEEFAEMIVQIDVLNAKLIELDEQINILDGKVKCPHCGKFGNADCFFCSGCGGKMPEITAPAEETPVVQAEIIPSCPNCGKNANSDDVFCSQCGTRI